MVLGMGPQVALQTLGKRLSSHKFYSRAFCTRTVRELMSICSTLHSGLQGELQHNRKYWRNRLQRNLLHLGRQRRGQGSVIVSPPMWIYPKPVVQVEPREEKPQWILFSSKLCDNLSCVGKQKFPPSTVKPVFQPRFGRTSKTHTRVVNRCGASSSLVSGFASGWNANRVVSFFSVSLCLSLRSPLLCGRSSDGAVSLFELPKDPKG